MAYAGGALALVGVAVARRKPRAPRVVAPEPAEACHAARVNVVADVLVGLVAALHLYFLVLEMFLWTTPTGRRVFGLEPSFAERVEGAGCQPGPLQRLPGRGPGLGPGLRPRRT